MDIPMRTEEIPRTLQHHTGEEEGSFMTSISLEQLTAVIALTLEYPGGLNVLIGMMAPPAAENLHRLIRSHKGSLDDLYGAIEGDTLRAEAERVSDLAEAYERTVASCGGWPHIVASVRQWTKDNDASWKLVIDHHCRVKSSRSRIDGPQLDKMVKDYGMSKALICRRVKQFPGDLANAIMRTPIEHREAV